MADTLGIAFSPRLIVTGGLAGMACGSVIACAYTFAQIHDQISREEYLDTWASFPVVARRMGTWKRNLQKWMVYGGFFGATHVPFYALAILLSRKLWAAKSLSCALYVLPHK